jgi:hypothetical protein
VRVLLQVEIRKEKTPMSATATPAREKVFRTIKIGTGFKNVDEIRKALVDSGIFIGEKHVNDIFDNPDFKVAAKEIEIDLVIRSVGRLGFKEGAKLEQIYARAKQFGLDLCPAEVGPQLRLQYKDQPTDEWLTIAMEPVTNLEPITGSKSTIGLFGIVNNINGLGLYRFHGGDDGTWDAKYRFVFSLRR